jgi:hypothetical protein
MTMQLNITTNLADVRRQFAGLEKQVNFAASKALNETAREVRKAIPAGLRRSLDRPTPFTAGEGATFVKPARRDSLVAEVLFKPRQASYLRYQVEGGVRSPTRRALRLPSAVKLNEYGNLPRGIIQQLISVARKESRLGKRRSRRIQVSNKLDLFYGDPRDVGGRNFPPGIYKIVKLSPERSQLVPLIVFPETVARYRKRVDLLAIARPVVASAFSPAFARALREALATAR